MALWSYGVTTVPARRETYLPRTLASLAAAGFDRPRLFIDGDACNHDALGLPCTIRDGPPLGAWGNFFSALLELYTREPVCERYAVFQDDVIAVRDLRAYLDACRYPDGRDGRPPGYWNLYTTLNSEWEVVDRGVRCGWIEGACMVNGDVRQRLQCGRGALGLVFNREAAGIVLGAPSAVQKPISTDRPRANVDGAVVTAMNMHRACPATGRKWEHGWREYVHGPSLLRHVGTQSAVRPEKQWEDRSNAHTFPGEDWSALGMSDAQLKPAA